jgi:hypothetical protein
MHGRPARLGSARLDKADVDAVACARTRKGFLTQIRMILRRLATLTLPGQFKKRAGNFHI